MYSCSLIFFFTTTHFHLVGCQHFSFSHRRYKISCFSSNEISLLCFLFYLSLQLFLCYPRQRLHLTNKEALTVLCSVVKHAGSGQSLKEVQGETREAVECFSLLLECFGLFLSDKEYVKLPTHRFLIFKTNVFSKVNQIAVSMFYTVIKHA